jgi:hypothetical protein
MEKWTKLYCSDYYEISDRGNVRSVERVVPHARYGEMRVKAKSIKTAVNKHGYELFAISDKDVKSTIYVHTAVFNSFNKTKPNGCRYNVIDHIDGDISKNRLENLQRITQSENVLKGDRHR